MTNTKQLREKENKLSYYLREIVVHAGNTGELHPEWESKIKALLQAHESEIRREELELLPKFLDEAIRNGSFYHNGINYRLKALSEGNDKGEV